ncbi:MAG: hypothetical protein J6Y74_03260, partial [Clostridia bacterium]|nr:hypothetical protein [Clostridia bacterium]
VTAASEGIAPDKAEKPSEDIEIPLFSDDLFADEQPDEIEEVSVAEEPAPEPVKSAEPVVAPEAETSQEKVQQTAIFIPTAVEEEEEEEAPAAEEKVDKKALRERERAAQKEREREEKERKKREKEEEKERKLKEKESKKAKPEPKKPAARPGMFVPSSFVPKGSAPVKKEVDDFDIFPTAAPTSTDDLFSTEKISSDSDEIEIPFSSSDRHGEDELVISKSSSFGEEEEEPKKDDEDLI